MKLKTDRYFRNIGAISTDEQQKLKQSSVCIVGLGGLGGYALELLARLGIGSITGIDCDRFETTNLNRQLLSNRDTIGNEKSVTALERIQLINNEVCFTAINERLTPGNADVLLAGHTIVMDALDSVKDRLMLSEACARLGIPLIHGAVNGWCGQAAAVYPNDDILNKLYANIKARNAPPAVLSFTPAAVASLQVSLTVRILLGRDKPKPNTLFLLDLTNCSITEIII